MAVISLVCNLNDIHAINFLIRLFHTYLSIYHTFIILSILTNFLVIHLKISTNLNCQAHGIHDPTSCKYIGSHIAT